MSKEKKMVPELRFPEFDGEWMKKRLGEIAILFNGYAFKSEDSKKDGVKWLKIANVGFGEIKWNEISYLPIEYKEKYKQYVLKENDLVLALTRPILQGKIKLARINKQDSPSLLNQRVGKIIAIENYSVSGFLEHLLSYNQTIYSIESTILGTDPPNISKNDFDTTNVIIPSINEQKKIATFLSLIDKKIELLERKIELLEEQKRGLLQKIFSQEIRFKKDDGSEFEEWGLEKLEDLGDFYNGLSGLSKENFTGGTHRFIAYTNVYNNPIINKEILEYVDIGVSKQNLVQNNDLIFTQSSETIDEIGLCSVWLDNTKNVYLNSFCFGFRLNSKSSIISYFLMMQLRYSNKRKSIIREGQGSTRFNLSPNRLKTIEIFLPSLNEQKKIISMFSEHDLLIKNSIQKLECTKELKKGLLQRVFI